MQEFERITFNPKGRKEVTRGSHYTLQNIIEIKSRELRAFLLHVQLLGFPPGLLSSYPSSYVTFFRVLGKCHLAQASHISLKRDL